MIEIVSEFVDGGYKPLGGRADQIAPNLSALLALLAEAQPIDQHGGSWDPAPWFESFKSRPKLEGVTPSLREAVERLAVRTRQPDGSHWISRGKVLAAGREGDVIDLFLATMIWGYGGGWGGWRTASIIEAEAGNGPGSLEGKLRGLIADARSGDMESLVGCWCNRHHVGHVRGLGAAFASKVAYFAAFGRNAGLAPLIADRRAAWGAWGLAGIWDSRRDPVEYTQYVALAHRWAKECGGRADEIERALFYLGPAIIKAWYHRR